MRNHLVEHQLIRRDLLEATIVAGPEHELDRRIESDQEVLERNIGSFASVIGSHVCLRLVDDVL